MKKMRIVLLLSIITCSVNAQQWSGDNNLTSTIYRNGSIGVNGLYLGRYGSSLSGDSNPYTISSYDNEIHDLILYGSSAATLNFRLLDGDIKLGSNTIPNIILYNSGSAFFSGNLGVGTTTPVNKLQIGNNPFGYNGNDLVVCNPNGALAIHNAVSHTYLYSNRDIAIRPGGGLMSIYARSDGRVGIGSSNPKATLQITNGQRDYQVNRIISGITEDSQGKNYLLLHSLSTGSPIEERYVMGKISGLRGGISAWNRKWTIEVNTSSAYLTNRGSILTYNEPASLVTVIYQGISYLAVEIKGESTLYDFSFTGYAYNEDLRIVYDQDITGAAQPFANYDPFTVQGNVGIGTTNPTQKLTVNGTVYSTEVKVDVNAGTGPDYVFEPTYQLPSLAEIENYIKANKHLPEVPSAKEMETNGINLSEMNMLLLKKVEELTLHLIEATKKIENQQEQINTLKATIYEKK